MTAGSRGDVAPDTGRGHGLSRAGPEVTLAADLAQFRTDDDQEYLKRFYIPGLRKAGDFRAAAVVNTEGKLFLHNTGTEFPAVWVKDSAQAEGSIAEVREGKASESELLAWIMPGPHKPTAAVNGRVR